MKEVKFRLTIIIFVSLLLIVNFSNTKVVQGQEYSYPSELTIDSMYEWEVTELFQLGSVSTGFLDFGDDVLEQGDKFSVKLIADINNITNGTPSELINPSNIWAEFYLNDEFKTNETDQIGLLDLDWLGVTSIGMNSFFLQPIIYENATGAYNYFVILDENFPKLTTTTSNEVESHGYYFKYDISVTMSAKLTSKSWIIKFEMVERETEDDLLNIFWEKRIETTDKYVELRFNVKTGFLTYLDYNYAWHQERTVEGSVDIDDRSINLLIKSSSLPTGAAFEWVFSFIGVAVIALIFSKQKRS